MIPRTTAKESADGRVANSKESSEQALADSVERERAYPPHGLWVQLGKAVRRALRTFPDPAKNVEAVLNVFGLRTILKVGQVVIFLVAVLVIHTKAFGPGTYKRLHDKAVDGSGFSILNAGAAVQTNARIACRMQEVLENLALLDVPSVNSAPNTPAIRDLVQRIPPDQLPSLHYLTSECSLPGPYPLVKFQNWGRRS